MIIYENVYLSHTYDMDRRKIIYDMKLSNFLNDSQIWFKLCEMTCEITTSFMKIKNHFNHFRMYLHF